MYALGQSVLTRYGDGWIIDIRENNHENNVSYAVQLSFGGVAYLQPDVIKRELKAKWGDTVVTRFGTGIVKKVHGDENVFVVSVNDELMYIHASEMELAHHKFTMTASAVTKHLSSSIAAWKQK